MSKLNSNMKFHEYISNITSSASSGLAVLRKTLQKVDKIGFDLFEEYGRPILEYGHCKNQCIILENIKYHYFVLLMELIVLILI